MVYIFINNPPKPPKKPFGNSMGMAKYRADLGKVVGIGRVGGLAGFGEGFGVPLWATVGMSSSPRTHVAFFGLPSPPPKFQRHFAPQNCKVSHKSAKKQRIFPLRSIFHRQTAPIPFFSRKKRKKKLKKNESPHFRFITDTKLAEFVWKSVLGFFFSVFRSIFQPGLTHVGAKGEKSHPGPP